MGDGSRSPRRMASSIATASGLTWLGYVGNPELVESIHTSVALLLLVGSLIWWYSARRSEARQA